MDGRPIRWWKPETEPHMVETLSFIKHACLLSHCSRVWLLATLRAVARQVSLSMGFSSKNTGVACHFLFQGNFPAQGSNLSPSAPGLQADPFLLSHHGNPLLPQEFTLELQTL